MNNVFGSGRPAAFLKNPTRGYQPSPWSPITVMGGAAVWGDQPFFTWGDVLLMGRDPVIRYGLKLLRSPFSRVEFNVAAQRPAVKRFVSVTLRRFWRRDLPRLLHNYFKWGRSAGGAEYKYNRRLRLMELARVREVKPYDADPQLYAPGSANAGQFAGYRLRTGMSGDMTMVGSPNCFFFAGYEELSPCCDVPRLAGAFVPYLEKNSPGGLRASRRLFYWTRAVGSTVVRYPDGSTKLRDGTTVNNEDIARQTGENRQNGTVIAIPNIRHAAIDGKFAWEIEDSPASGDVAGIRDAVRDLDEEELLGLEIPPEIVRAADVGSGWSGRSIPMETWLGGADELTGMLLDTFRQQILDPLVRLNFRTDVYEVENISLLEQFRKENAGGKDDQNPPDGKPPSPGGGGPDVLPSGDGANSPSYGGASLSGLSPAAGAAVKKSRKAMRRTADVRRAAAIAMMLSREQWLNRGKPEEGQAELDRLAELADDPDRLEQVAGGSADLSWVAHGESGSGKPRWKDTETGKLRYQKSMPGTRTAAREKSVASAKRAYELSKLVNNGTATSSHLRELAGHIPALTVGKLRTYRQILMARFNNARTRDAMVKALLDHVRQERADDAVKPQEAKPKGTPNTAKSQSMTALVRRAGGIDPDSVEFLKHYSGVRHALEDAIPLGVFKKGGRGLDELAKSLESEGYFTTPDGKTDSEHLLDLIKSRAQSLLADHATEYQNAEEDYHRELAAAHEHASAAEVADALRGGTEAGASEGEVTEADESGASTEPDKAEGVDDSFDFGANMADKPADEPKPAAGQTDLFGRPVPKSFASKGGSQTSIDDAIREEWANRAKSFAEDNGLKIESWDAGGRFKAGGKVYQVGKAEDGYPIIEIES